MMRKIVVITVLVLVVSGLAVLFARPAGVPVTSAVVRRGSIAQYVDSRGKTRLPETCRITVPESGMVEPVLLVEGTLVQAGQIVAQMVDADLQIEAQQALAAVARLDAQLAYNQDVSLEDTTLQQARLFVESFRSTLDAVKAQVEAGKADLEFAKRNLDRIESLHQTKSTTDADLDNARLRSTESNVQYQQDMLIETATTAFSHATDLLPDLIQQYKHRKKLQDAMIAADRAEAQAVLDRVNLKLQRGRMASPINGVVLSRAVENRQHMAAGQLLLEIGDLSRLEIEAELLTIDAVQVKPGDPVEIIGPAIGDIPVQGVVSRLEPAGFTKISSLGVEQQRVLTVIAITDADRQRLLTQQRLGVGYRLQVRILTHEQPNVLTVPRSALFRNSVGDWQLYTIQAGRAVLKTVQVGMLNTVDAEILNGVAEGETIVAVPENTVSDGVRVTE